MARLICPACTAPSLTYDTEGKLTCPYCGIRIVSEAQVCTACSHINPAEAEECLNCGEPLTTTTQVILRQGKAGRQPFFLEHARSMAAELKSRGNVASEERLDRFRQVDRIRELRDSEELARREIRDRKLLLASAGAVGLLVVAILIGLLLTVLR